MTKDDYRTAIAALGMNQVQAAAALNIGLRTSRRYAAEGIPEKVSPYIRGKLSLLMTKHKVQAPEAIRIAIREAVEREND